MAKVKKYYWLKLKDNFFKRHDIRIIEDMPNGKDYVLFYLKLLVESISHEGSLRFSDTIPYNEQMLSTITNTNIVIVRSAIKIFEQLDLMEKLDDGTIYMIETQKMLGSETEWAEKKRLYRQRQYQLKDISRTNKDNVRQEIEKDIEIDIDIETEKDIEKNLEKKKSSRFTPPSLQEVQEYCQERNNNIDAQNFIDFYESKGWYVGKNKMKSWKAAVRTWESRQSKEVKKTSDDIIKEWVNE
jgi:predicted phage replisome organizer